MKLKFNDKSVLSFAKHFSQNVKKEKYRKNLHLKITKIDVKTANKLLIFPFFPHNKA